MSAESNAEAGIKQSVNTSAVRRQKLKDDILGCCGTTAVALCAIPASVIAFVALPLLFIAFVASILALTGFLFLLTGHAILRAGHLDGYDFTLESSMQIGAIGALIFMPAVVFFNMMTTSCYPAEQDAFGNRRYVTCTERTYCNIFELCKTTAFGAIVGAIGSSVFRIHGHVGMDTLHAATAGALGGAILGPGAIIGFIVGSIVLAALIQALPCEVGCWDNRSINTWS